MSGQEMNAMSGIREVTTLATLPALRSQRLGPKAALIVRDEPLSYDALERRSNQAAHALRREGIHPGARVAVLGRESLDSLVLLFGVAKARAVYVGLNWRLAPEELAYILEDSGAQLLFVDEESAALVPRVFEKMRGPLPVVRVGAPLSAPGAFAHWCEGAAPTPLDMAYDPEEVVVQLYTSGTTGRPKGVLLPHRSFLAISHALEAHGECWIGWTEASVSMLFVPTFHIGGLWWLVRGLALGSTQVVLRSFEPATILSSLARYRVTHTCMVPAMMQILLGEPGIHQADLSSLKAVVYGGAPISTALLEKGRRLLGCDFAQIYGMTETGNCAVCLRPEDHQNAPASRLRAAGRPFPGVQVRVLDEQGHEVPPGTIGQICLNSPARMAGYWHQPEETQKTLVGEWVMTGDAGYVDAEGFVYICDRVKDMIISAGENIYPAEIENVIRSHPEVADVAVIGVPDELWGEAVKALVVKQPGSTLRAGDILRHTRGALAEFKVPKSVEFTEGLPRNAAGKLLKGVLREPYWKGRERRVN
ncbi:long-chain acyl-CoA synthetase [Stigmatella aurantiaca]|uniref:Long-chain acyl-CoA synthetase n=2 Tax=Stigmatella aurantiaca TaxID=41 RepID=A0A1H7TMU4_STIAU|nr:long-chain acyl-CoA synthetase [Stigmatella aurantiaca]